MGAAWRQFVLGSLILGLFSSSLLKGVLTNSTNRCDYPPCSCDHYGRLTCDCKNDGEVCPTHNYPNALLSRGYLHDRRSERME